MFERRMMGTLRDLFGRTGEPWIFAEVSMRSLSVRCFSLPTFDLPSGEETNGSIGRKTLHIQLDMPTYHSTVLTSTLTLSLSPPLCSNFIKMLQLVIWCQTVAMKIPRNNISSWSAVLKQLTHTSAQALNQLACGREGCHYAFGCSSSNHYGIP